MGKAARRRAVHPRRVQRRAGRGHVLLQLQLLGSVIQNFLKHKAAVVCLILFLFLVIFSFIALAIGKYDYQTLVTDSSLAFRKPNSEYWFGTDNLGRDYWCQVWYATQVSIRLALIVAVGESILASSSA